MNELAFPPVRRTAPGCRSAPTTISSWTVVVGAGRMDTIPYNHRVALVHSSTAIVTGACPVSSRVHRPTM
ncbi:hypothetical protein [Streptomyces sp. NPDC001781]